MDNFKPRYFCEAHRGVAVEIGDELPPMPGSHRTARGRAAGSGSPLVVQTGNDLPCDRAGAETQVDARISPIYFLFHSRSEWLPQEADCDAPVGADLPLELSGSTTGSEVS